MKRKLFYRGSKSLFGPLRVHVLRGQPSLNVTNITKCQKHQSFSHNLSGRTRRIQLIRKSQLVIEGDVTTDYALDWNKQCQKSNEEQELFLMRTETYFGNKTEIECFCLRHTVEHYWIQPVKDLVWVQKNQRISWSDHKKRITKTVGVIPNCQDSIEPITVLAPHVLFIISSYLFLPSVCPGGGWNSSGPQLVSW